VVDVELRCAGVTIGILLGPDFYDRNFPVVRETLASRIHELRRHIHVRTSWLLVIIVHDAAMFEIFQDSDRQPFCFLHWTELSYLKTLQTGDNLAARLPPEQMQWTERAIMKSAALCIQRSLAELRASNMPSAIEWAQRSIEIDSRDPAGYNLLTQLYLQSGAVDHAAESAQQALDRAEGSSISMIRMSEVELRRNNLPGALDWATRSTEQEPKNPWTHSHLAEVLAAAGNQPDAVKAAERAARLAPTIVHFAGRLAHMKNLTVH
jgi:tetratricopeptide (TPR) repeat protein